MSSLVKIAVTVTADKADELREAVGKAGGGAIGEYSFCSFSVTGTGRFIPSSDATPAIGSANNLEKVQEERIEITCQKDKAKEVIAAIRKSHSYEEPAIDVYPLISEEEL